jgi:catechol 2,3-dioxygenase-like lactoylglutathione lyase family enzyme
MTEIQRIGNVFYRVHDMESAVAFYRDLLGLTVKFRDGDRWAAFDVAGVTFALEGSPSTPAGGATVSFRTDDVGPIVERLRSAGVEVRLVEGAHERQAIIQDPAGNTLILYNPVSRP